MQRSSGRQTITFAVLCVGVATFALLQSVVNPVLLTLQVEFDTGPGEVTWVITAYLASASVATPIIGRIGDRVGKKRMLVFTLAALAAGSAVAALATSFAVLILGRVIQGIGGGVLPLTFGLIRDEFAADKVSRAVGTASSLLAVGAGVGLVAAGPIVDGLGYRWLFWVPMIMNLVAALVAAVWLLESGIRSPGKVNIANALLLSSWLVALLIAVGQGHHWGWSSWPVIGLLAASAVLFPLWILAELRSSHPLIDMHTMREPTVRACNLVAMLTGAGVFSLMAFLPQYMQAPAAAGYGFDVTVARSGLMLMPFMVCSFVGGVSAGALFNRIGSNLVLLAGCLLASAGTLMLGLARSEPWMVQVEAAVLGLAFGSSFAALSSLVVDAVPETQTGAASGMNTNIRTVGGAIGTALFGTLIASSTQPSGYPSGSGYTHGFVLMACLGLAATGVAAAIPSARRRVLCTSSPSGPVGASEGEHLAQQ